MTTLAANRCVSSSSTRSSYHFVRLAAFFAAALRFTRDSGHSEC